ncbi:MAG: ferritin-like domain-containing protein [Candidatus Acidiferrum sp.]
MMKENTLRDLFLDELRDLYDAENRIVKALPKLAKAANSEELRSGFEEHLEQTKEHVERLKQVFGELDEKASAKKCPGIIGILQEGVEMIDEDYEGSVADAALISAAQRVEHYEIAAYGCVHSWAQELGEEKAAELLEKTLNEEKETDEKLTELAEQINASANSEGSAEEGEEEQEETATPIRKGKSRSANA